MELRWGGIMSVLGFCIFILGFIFIIMIFNLFRIIGLCLINLNFRIKL